jgi:hypothetical protein
MDPALWVQRQGDFFMDFKRSAGANLEQFYIGGRQVDPIGNGRWVVSHSNETVLDRSRRQPRPMEFALRRGRHGS